MAERAESNEEVGTLGTIIYYLGFLWTIVGTVYFLGAIGCASMFGMMGASGPGAAPAAAMGGIATLPLIIVGVVVITFGYLVKKFAYKIENFILSLVGQLGEAARGE